MTTGERSADLGFEIMQEYVDSATSVGGREFNEDACISYAIDPASSPWHLCAVLAVADGLGGHQAGDVASQIAISMLEEVFVNDNIGTLKGITFESNPADVLEALFYSINEKILSYDSETTGGERSMGTTFTAALVFENGRALVGHVGDSRAYVLHGDAAQQVTEDHSPVGSLIAAGVITEREAVQRDDRNVVDQALGTDPHVDVDILEVELAPGDIVLLTSDGLTNVIFSDEMSALVKQYPSIQSATAGIIEAAILRDTDDNATVAMLAVSGPEAAGLAVHEVMTEEAEWSAGVAGDMDTVITGGPTGAQAVGDGVSVKGAERRTRARERGDRSHNTRIILAVVVAFLVIAAGLSTFLIFFVRADHRPEVEVPSVRGLAEEQAKAKLEDAGFKFSAEYKTDNSAEAGKVLDQSPKAKEKAKKGSRVAVLVATRGMVDVPKVCGMKQDEAIALLGQNHLNYKINQQPNTEQSLQGEVLSQNPAEGSAVDAGSDVELVVAVYQEEHQPQDQQTETQRVKKTRQVTCATCGGSGVISQDYDVQEPIMGGCPTCGGKGAIAGPNGPVTCPTCGGSGGRTETVTKTRQVTCTTCGGTGSVIEDYWVYE